MENHIDQIKQGKIFIYPTDTIYGLGCDATNEESVEKIKKIKERDRDKPLSIIAPSFEWINQNCHVDVDADLHKYLPGPYTIILKKKDPDFLKHISSTDTIGIRIPDCDFTKQIQEAGVPFISTSVNLSGQPFAKSVNEISQEIKSNVDVIVDEGELNGKPSTLIIGGKEVERN